MNYLAIATFGAIIFLDFEILAPSSVDNGSVKNTSITQPQAVQELRPGTVSSKEQNKVAAIADLDLGT
jgi:hypothetical protein